MKSLKQIRADKRVYEVNVYDDASEWDYDYKGKVYEINLEDEYEFSDGSRLATAFGMKELNELMNDIYEANEEED